MTELRTERLVLRQWREADREPFAALNAEPEVMEFFQAPLTRAESDAMVDRAIDHIDAEGWGLWAVEVRSTGEFIGFTGLAVPHLDASFMPNVEIGWRLAKQGWGHGYATEAARGALAHGFDRLDLPEIVSFTSVVNTRSQAVMRRIGMHHSPADNFDHPYRGLSARLRPHVLYRLTHPEWRDARQRTHVGPS